MADQAVVNSSITKWLEGLEHNITGVNREAFVGAFLSPMPEIASKAIEDDIKHAFSVRNFKDFRISIVGALAIAYQCGANAQRNGKSADLLVEYGPSKLGPLGSSQRATTSRWNR